MAKRKSKAEKYLLPSEIMVRREIDGDDSYLIADASISGFSEGDFVGIYELREVKVKRTKHSLETE